MVERYIEVTDEYVKQLEQEIDNLKKINEEHKKINGKLREEYNKIQNLYESVFAESQKQKEVIDKLNFIKNRKNQGASQENINKMAIEFVNSYLKEVE